MLKSLRISFLFYQNFVWVTFPISIFGCYLVWESGMVTFAMPIFFIKIITNGLIGVMFHFFKQNQLYFFQNLGVSAVQLYSSAMFIDMILWLSMLVISLIL